MDSIKALRRVLRLTRMFADMEGAMFTALTTLVPRRLMDLVHLTPWRQEKS